MDIYTYSEARQKLASVLDKAETTGKVLIRRQDGRTFALSAAEAVPQSPLDVPAIAADISTAKLVALVRSRKAHTAGWKKRG